MQKLPNNNIIKVNKNNSAKLYFISYFYNQTYKHNKIIFSGRFAPKNAQPHAKSIIAYLLAGGFTIRTIQSSRFAAMPRNSNFSWEKYICDLLDKPIRSIKP